MPKKPLDKKLFDDTPTYRIVTEVKMLSLSETLRQERQENARRRKYLKEGYRDDIKTDT